MSPAELLERLEAALASPHNAGEIELSAVVSQQGMTRFADSRVTQTGDVADVVVQARVAQDGAVGAARTNALDVASLAQAIDRARAGARAQKGSAQATGPGATAGFHDGRAPLPDVAPSWDEETAGADAAARAALVEAAFGVTTRHDVGAAGLAATTAATYAVATRAGARRSHRVTMASLDVIATERGPSDFAGAATTVASGRATRHAISLGAVRDDARRLAEDACAGALRSRDPVTLPPGPYDVILEPAAVGELLEWLALTSLGARTVEDGSSFLAGRTGERVTGPVTLVDDALSGADGCPTLPFDAEGTPKRVVTFLDGGIAGLPVYDRATARLAGAEPTGHASPLADDVFEGGPGPQHLHFAAGPDDAADLLARVERGLWVTRFHYVNGLVDTRRGLMTGMTRDGLFLIENGKLSRSVRNMRWTESVLEAFLRLGGVTRARQLLAAGLSASVAVCPTLLVRQWRFG